MPDERTSGVILRTRPLTETSLIVHWLTPDLGRVSTVAKGARRPKSSFRGKLDLFYEAEFSFQRSRRSELHTLREVALKSTHLAIRVDLPKLEQLSYFVALIERTTEVETPLPEFHRLFLDALQWVEAHPVSVLTVFAFEFRLLDHLGLTPAVEESAMSDGSKAIARRLPEPAADEMLMRLTLTPVQRAELNRFLQSYLLMHLDRLPSSRPAALV